MELGNPAEHGVGTGTQCSKEIRNGGIRNSKLQGDGLSNADDMLSIIDDDVKLAGREVIIGTTVQEGFQLQMSPSLALDVSLVNWGVLVRLGLGWFSGVITCKAQKKHKQNNGTLGYGCRGIRDGRPEYAQYKVPFERV